METVERDDSRLEMERELMDMGVGYWKSRALNYVMEDNIAKHLQNGPRSAFLIANEIGVNPEFLYRVMRALSTQGIFKEEEEYGVFSQSPKSAILCENDWVNGVIFESEDFAYRSWFSFRESIKSGKSMGPKSIGYDSFWDIVEKNPSYGAVFREGMTVFTNHIIHTILNETDFSPFETIADLGGSQGVLLLSILKKLPSVKKGINFDLPSTIDNNKLLVSEREAQHSSTTLSRFTEVSGSFFDSVPQADCYILKMILHDWSDEKCVSILTTVSKCMKPNSKVYIFDAIIDSKNQPNYKVWLDLHMLHHVDGKERSRKEWGELASLAGFQVVEITPFSEKYSRSTGKIVLSKSA
ncbi:hypothetical protein CYY_001162 [Polysphondylium violaceum]|uniref:O-methyltransferase domain-containing protein n=1 Tax=Polysphondylium violaceum TaxID=133409 RepID=A0A8J4Q3P7_9MYCE|nr:hypothetical protein CYY_001162 [Polysphondylium violaceum]